MLRIFLVVVLALGISGVTTMFTLELPNLDTAITRLPIADISGLSDNVVLLRHREDDRRTYRLLSVLKVRDSDYDPSLRRFEITGTGILVARDAAGTSEPWLRWSTQSQSVRSTDEPPREGS